jgi:hypothetical protein
MAQFEEQEKIGSPAKDMAVGEPESRPPATAISTGEGDTATVSRVDQSDNPRDSASPHRRRRIELASPVRMFLHRTSSRPLRDPGTPTIASTSLCEALDAVLPD